MSFDFVNAPIYNNMGRPQIPNINNPQMTQQQMLALQQQQQALAELETPQITVTDKDNFKPKFTIKKEDGSTVNDTSIIKVDRELPDQEKEKKKRGRPRKEASSGSNIIRAGNVEVEDTSSIYSYSETTGMLHETLHQIDSLNLELMQEFEQVRHSRTMKNKYNTLVGLTENVSTLINSRIQAIKEINSTISKANDLDYKKEKDRREAQADVDDDKYIADLYKSFLQNPTNFNPSPQLPQVDASLFGSGIVRADLPNSNNSNNVDASYLSYLSNLSPEQNLIRYENNPNVKQVVVFDAASGNKFFQMMDMSTGQVIPNVPVYDQMFMEDTTLDLKTKVAKNINLNESFPIVVINEGVTNQY